MPLISVPSASLKIAFLGGHVILTINDHSSVLKPESIQSELIRFNYDVEKAAKAVEDSPLQNVYAESLRGGIQCW